MNEEYSAKLFEELKEIKKEIKELRSLNECKYLGFCETAKYLGVSYYTVMNDWKSWIKYGVSPSKYKTGKI